METERDRIREYMLAKSKGASTGSKELRYDATKKRFVLAERGTTETLPIVLDEDLQAFQSQL
jgi:hypothetical protein